MKSKSYTDTALSKITNGIYNRFDYNFTLSLIQTITKIRTTRSEVTYLQALRLHADVSPKKLVSFGVPQAILLGPIFFTILIKRQCQIPVYLFNTPMTHNSTTMLA